MRTSRRQARPLLMALLLAAVAAVTGISFLGTDGEAPRTGPAANERRAPADARRAIAALDDDAARATVSRVVDGDTAVVRFRDAGGTATARVRYVGVDTPETVHPSRPVECFGREASAANRRWVEGKRVRMAFDRERTDRYGRLLAAVVPDGWKQSVNERLVAEGLATVLTIAPNRELAPTLEKLSDEARRAGRGLWAACPDRLPSKR